jgi:hypothetical protein
VLREAARRMLTQAVEAEVETFLSAHAGLLDQQGRARNGRASPPDATSISGPVCTSRPGWSTSASACW